MLEEQLKRLGESAPDRSLETLEADVWRGVALRRHETALARRVISLQGGLLLLAIVGSAAAGIKSVESARAPASALMPGASLTPAYLLLRDHS